MEDKPWYYDKAFWSRYLDLLVAARFNRFTFSYGLEYDFPRGVTDDYFHFPSPHQSKSVRRSGTRTSRCCAISQRKQELEGFISSLASGPMLINGRTARLPTTTLKASHRKTTPATVAMP